MAQHAVHRPAAEDVLTEEPHREDEVSSLRHRVLCHDLQHFARRRHDRTLIQHVDRVALFDATAVQQDLEMAARERLAADRGLLGWCFDILGSLGSLIF